ncbi:NAD(P)H-binding protein [Nakamurella deserti]|uniref:NAD(P)H-binding protein n=1 Tax=Nakamurella deserti TaxID=2164074 RepID=UPI000DBE212E|nr:NAD(P)H-binding protein [Nakamurella deserti]
MPLSVLVTGASGFIGSHLVPALLAQGHHVRAMTRHPDTYQGQGEAVAGDVFDPDSLIAPLEGVDVAYYLVHSLDSNDFVDKDAKAAQAFSAAAAAAGVRRIIYLGGLGSDDDALSPHLKSRREVEKLLASDGIPVTSLRAAVVIGNGGISWEMTRQLVKHLPAMLAPKWVYTRTQPIALPDVIRYLVGVLDKPESEGVSYEIGGPDVLRYIDMMRRAAKVMKHRKLPIIPVPLLSPRLSSGWLALVTDVDMATARNLIDSMTNEVVVKDDKITRLLPGRLIGYDEAVELALQSQAEEREHETQEEAAEPA